MGDDELSRDQAASGADAGAASNPVQDSATRPHRSRTSYDEIPYLSHAFGSTHPANLGMMATLFGMSPAPPANCRVLELGCASGGNLLPMAQAAPNAEFVGIDLSSRQIADGRELLSAAQLRNVQLEHLSITEFGPQFGMFDYIIAHGVYSWVPPEVQDRMFEICREYLNPHGVAYISYNTYPGWHLRATVREMMNYHARQFAEPQERIEQSRALLDFLHQANAGRGSLYGQILEAELEILRTRQDTYLFHEHLEEYNEPEYFYRFVERAGELGLRFLGEASLGEMLPVQFDSEVGETLRRIAPDIIHMEQYHDFLRNRTFRRTLLCHEEIEPDRDLGPASLGKLHFASPLIPEAETIGTGSDPEIATRFKHPDGGEVSVSHPLETALLLGMHELAPVAIRFEDLALLARTCLDGGPVTDADRQVVGETVMKLLSAGFIEARLGSDSFEPRPGLTPRASHLARIHAEREIAPVNFLHEAVYLDEFRRRLLTLLDGSRDRSALLEALAQMVESGDMTLHRNEDPVVGPAAIRDALGPVLEQALSDLGRLALLYAEPD